MFVSRPPFHVNPTLTLSGHFTQEYFTEVLCGKLWCTYQSNFFCLPHNSCSLCFGAGTSGPWFPLAMVPSASVHTFLPVPRSNTFLKLRECVGSWASYFRTRGPRCIKEWDNSLRALAFPFPCGLGYTCQPNHHTPCENCQGWSSKTSCATSAPKYTPLPSHPYCICSPYHCPYQWDDMSHYNPSATQGMIPPSCAALVTHQHMVYGVFPLLLPIPLESGSLTVFWQ